MTTEASTDVRTDFDLRMARKALKAIIPSPVRTNLKARLQPVMPDLLAAQKRKCTVEQLCAALKLAGLEIKPHTLRPILAEARREVDAEAPQKRPARTRGKANGAATEKAVTGVADSDAMEAKLDQPAAVPERILPAQNSLGQILAGNTVAKRDDATASPQTVQPAAAPVVAGAFAWPDPDKLTADMNVAHILSKAPAGFIDCRVNTIITPQARRIEIGALEQHQKHQIAVATRAHPSEAAIAALTRLMTDIDAKFAASS
jgi:hypothetical protein